MRFYLKKRSNCDEFFIMYQNDDTDIPVAKVDKLHSVEIIEENFEHSDCLRVLLKRAKMTFEAIDRMRTIGLHENAVKDFLDGVLNYSERTPYGGALFWIHQDDKLKSAVESFENEYEGLVYHATHEHTAFGECLSLLYVSKHEEEWADDREDLIKDNNGIFYPMSYVVNLTCPDCSEFGTVGMVERSGGLVRVL